MLLFWSFSPWVGLTSAQLLDIALESFMFMLRGRTSCNRVSVGQGGLGLVQGFAQGRLGPRSGLVSGVGCCMPRALPTGARVALNFGLWASRWQRAQTAGENIFVQTSFSLRTRIHCIMQYIAHITSRNSGNTSRFGSCLSPTRFGRALETTMKRIFAFTLPECDVLTLRGR